MPISIAAINRLAANPSLFPNVELMPDYVTRCATLPRFSSVPSGRYHWQHFKMLILLLFSVHSMLQTVLELPVFLITVRAIEWW